MGTVLSTVFSEDTSGNSTFCNFLQLAGFMIVFDEKTVHLDGFLFVGYRLRITYRIYCHVNLFLPVLEIDCLNRST